MGSDRSREKQRNAEVKESVNKETTKDMKKESGRVSKTLADWEKDKDRGIEMEIESTALQHI